MARKRINKATTSSYVLPSSDVELKSFSQKFKIDMMEQVVSSIEFAIVNGLPYVEAFQFKNSDFVITLAEKDFLSNLDNIFNYYMNNEVYENCSRVARLQNTIKENITTTDEKQKR